MDIVAATADYEAWLSGHMPLLPADLQVKHDAMTAGLFPFLRATFYRWAQLWPQRCPELLDAPEVLAVGDLHVENFGTWRDSEGRLIWGANDLDEAYPLPYTHDLVRLAASAGVAILAGSLHLTLSDACNAILEGYRPALLGGGQPFVLDGLHEWLRKAATGALRNPVTFWRKLDALPIVSNPEPPEVVQVLEAALPAPGLHYHLAHRIAGLGSLGRPRWTAMALWQGGKVAREAKAVAPSACLWAQGQGDQPPRYQDLLDSAVRARDPFVRLSGSWILRRLGPDCSRIELASLSPERDEARLLKDMGWETANLHLGTPAATAAIAADLDRRAAKWLRTAAEAMVQATQEDHRVWQAGGG